MRNISALLFILVLIGVLVSVGVSYHKVFIAEAYDVEYASACDPETHRCFMYAEECDDTEECSEPEYYMVIRSSADISTASCEAGNDACELIYCDSEQGEAYVEILGECSEESVPEVEMTASEEMTVDTE